MILATKNSLIEKKHLFSRIYSVLSNNFFYLLILTVFLILIELAFFILCNESYLDTFALVSHKMHLPLAAIMPGILFFVFAQLLVHFCFCLLMALIAAVMVVTLNIQTKNHLFCCLSIWLTGAVTVVLANSYYFPNSHFAQLVPLGAHHSGSSRPDESRGSVSDFTSAATSSEPNIILVGVDSLRPDMLAFFSGEANTPFINKFLAKATVFSEAITPLARTYPSWVGILTGQYPLQTGVRTNLSGVTKKDLTQTLPALLRHQGYETLYATDETRFSNIDNRFGFDASITPPVGLNDFLLGTFNDFPLSNLVVNSFVGKWLFPYSYANRAAYVTYNPDSFLNLLRSTLLHHHHKPLFLAVHFCLPHHPYLYDRVVGESLTGQERYMQSIERADQQLRDFFTLLQQARLLDHAVVVLLSDHGEALEFAGDRLTEREAYLPRHQSAPEYYPVSKNKLAMDQSVGHGTDVLGLPQYHSLLAFRLYGLGEQRVAVVPGVVSLLDIKPTILDVARMKRFLFHPGNGIKTEHHVGWAEQREAQRQTLSLSPFIIGTTIHPPTRMLFLESDYSPDALRSVYPETRKLLLEGADLFEINPKSTRLTIKNEMLQMIIKSKQRAVIYGDWMLAFYPQANHTNLPVLVNLTSGAWTTDLSTSFAKASPARSMTLALQQFYGDEVR